MTKRLIKTRKDHRRSRAVLTENTVAQTLSPAIGALTAGVVGTPHAGVTFALSAPVGTARYSVSVGTLPTGLSMTSAGVLSGTPTAAANYSFSVTGTDEFGNTKTNAYTMVVTV